MDHQDFQSWDFQILTVSASTGYTCERHLLKTPIQSNLLKSATCVKAPALNIPDQFLYKFVLFIPKTHCPPYDGHILPVKILIAHTYRQLTWSVN